MKKEDIRGLSTVVATLLIILLVLVAAGIIWVVVRNVMTKNTESVSLGQFTISLEIVSIRQTPQDVNIKVRRNAGEGEIEGIVFSIFDGEETHLYEKHNVSLQQLETKTFVVNYQGKIVSISINPIFLGEDGSLIKGNTADTYYIYSDESGNGGGYIDPNCTINCTGKECGNNGCGGTCGEGCSGGTPYCINGECKASSGGVESDCSCSASICVGTTCDDGLGGNCYGTLQPDCTNEFGYPIMCGPSENGCGGCGNCDSGWHCLEGTCQQDCTVNCTGKECGSNGCGGFCGYCNLLYGSNYKCNATGLCEECTPDCGIKECGSVPNKCGTSCGNCTLLHNSSYNCNALGRCEMCTPNCGERECGAVPNGCGESCGNCSELYGYPEDSCTSEGVCYLETFINNGTILSVWPYPQGRMLFDSENLPTSPGTDYIGYYVKFPGSSQSGCMQIYDFVTPVNPIVYNRSYMKISEDPTSIEAGDKYEVWENYSGCCPKGNC
jgi:hypothetical protein